MAFAYIPMAVRADEPGLPPMGSLAAVAYFAIPSAVLVLSVHVLLPMLSTAGASGFTKLFLCLGAPLAGLLVASLVGYRQEGHEWRWTSFRNRFRLHAPSLATLVWTVALALWVMFFAPRLLGFTVPWIIGALPPQPAVMGLFDIQPGQFLGVPLEGNPWPILGFVLYLSVNVVGEELKRTGIVGDRVC